MHLSIAIVYESFGGNTEDLAKMIQKQLLNGGHPNVHLYSCYQVKKNNYDLSLYDYVLFGSLTWDEGKLPLTMRKLLKKILIDQKQPFINCSVFGTGETQWGDRMYCRAVDEMEYHLTKNNKTVNYKLKIEQNPLGKEKKIEDFVKCILKETLENDT